VKRRRLTTLLDSEAVEEENVITVDGEEETEDAEDPFDAEKEAKLALVEVFECFCSGMTPCTRPVHVLDINSLMNRKHELSIARKLTADSSDQLDSAQENLPPPVLVRCVKDGKKSDVGLEGEEETVSKLLEAVCAMRRKHKLPPLEWYSSGATNGSDDHAMTFAIVAADRSSSSISRRDPDEEWLLVGRETAGQTTSDDGIYPIHSIYSFFVVLNSDTVIQSTPSPTSSQEESEDTSSASSSSSSLDGEDAQQTSPSSDSSLLSTVKQHEDCAWSILAAIHVTGPETIDGSSDGSVASVFPDLVVVDDPLCLINEYIRYLQGDDAPPRSGGRKRRRIHVHEKYIDRRTCRIRILTTAPEPESTDSGPKAEQQDKSQELLQAKLLQEQQELLHILDQKLRALQQAQDMSSSSSSSGVSSSNPSCSDSPDDLSESPENSP